MKTSSSWRLETETETEIEDDLDVYPAFGGRFSEDLCVQRGRITFWRAGIRIVVGVWVIKVAVTVGGGEAAGVDQVLVGLPLNGCRRGRNV